MPKRKRAQHVDDPAGYVVSIDYGNELDPYRTLARAVWYAKAAMREGVEDVQVWHRLRDDEHGTYSAEVDPNKDCEFHANRDTTDPKYWELDGMPPFDD